LFNRSRKSSGVTITEVLIGSAILSLFLLFGYRVFFGVSAGFSRGNWALSTQNSLRNALNFVREEMQKASHRTEITVSTVDVTNRPFQLNEGTFDSNTQLAEWSIGIPFRTTAAVDPGAVYQCRLFLENGAIRYTKTLAEGSPGVERLYNNHLVLDNVALIELEAVPFDPDNIATGSLIIMRIEVEHPDRVRYPGLRAEAETGARVEVEVTGL